MNDKGEMFTFALGKFDDGRPACFIVLLKGKHKVKPKGTKLCSHSFNHLIESKYYAGLIMTEHFKRIFDKKLKPGEVRYGRLKLRMIKRKK